SGPGPSPARRSACAVAACRISAGRVRGVISTCSSTSSSRRGCRSASASCWRTTRPRAARPSRALIPGSSARSATRLDETSGRWLELSVEADVEAVEAVSEILSRVASGGTSVEPAFDLVDEGLDARVDPGRPSVVRAYVPARDRGAAERAAADAAEALGHLQAFGLRPIGEVTTRLVHEADWAEAWKAHFPVIRVGRRIVIKPTWRRHRAKAGDVLVALAPALAAQLRRDGTIVASGIFADRLSEVRVAFARARLDVGEVWNEGDWVALEAMRH